MDAEGERSLVGCLLSGLLIVVAVAGYVLGCVSGSMARNASWQKESVKAGHAEWITTKEGLTEWKWKEAAQ